jgi:hypothetical protein
LIAPSVLNSQSDKGLKLRRDHSCRVPYPERPNFFAAELAANLLFLLKVNGISIPARHDEMATPSKPAQKTARAVEGPRPGAAGNQACVHGERRRGAELD